MVMKLLQASLVRKYLRWLLMLKGGPENSEFTRNHQVTAHKTPKNLGEWGHTRPGKGFKEGGTGFIKFPRKDTYDEE